MANVNLAGQAWDQNNFDRLRQVLEDTRNSPDRGFEWYYWQRQGHLNLKTLRGHLDSVDSMAFSPDGQRIVTGSDDRTARVWDAASGRELFKIMGHNGPVNSVGFSQDGHRIITSSDDQTARVWEAATGRELFKLMGHRGSVSSAAFSRDGQWIVTGSHDQTAKVWEVATRRVLVTLEGHTDLISSVAFSPDRRRIVTGSFDQTARVWEAASGRELHQLIGHSQPVYSVAFFPDGQRVITGGTENIAKVWDAESGLELPLQRLVGRGTMTSVAISPDGQQIVTGSYDQSAKVWEAARADQVIAWEEEERVAKQSQAGWRQELAALQREQAARQMRQRINLARGDEGAIKRWLVLAPIRLGPGENGAQALDAEQIKGEGQLRPKAGDRVVVGIAELKWQEVVGEDYAIDFNAISSRETPGRRVAYAVCYIRSDAEQHDLQMLLGCNERAKVYLNGTSIYDASSSRYFTADQNSVPRISLIAGLNVLMFKVGNEIGEWQGSIRITDAQGNPVRGLRITLNPE